MIANSGHERHSSVSLYLIPIVKCLTLNHSVNLWLNLQANLIMFVHCSAVKNEVVVNNRWGAKGSGPQGDYRSLENQEKIIYRQKFKWENAVPIDSKSWGFRRDAPMTDYLSSQKLIRLLVQAVR